MSVFDKVTKTMIPDDDSTVVTNAAGGKQAFIGERFDLLPVHSLLEVTKVLAQGEQKYGQDNWRLISAREHVNHALRHLFLWLIGDTKDNHLTNAATRTLFALDMETLSRINQHE